MLYTSVQFRAAGRMVRGIQVAKDGSFTIWKVSPGKYELSAGGGANGLFLSTASMELEVIGQSVENVDLRFVDKGDINGHVTFDAAPTPPPDPKNSGKNPPAPVRRLLFSGATFGGSAVITDDGNFVLKLQNPGKYRMSLTGGTGYIRSIRVGGQEIEGSKIDLSNGAAVGPIEVAIGSDMGEITGTVTDSKGPAAGVLVALFPEYVGIGYTPSVRARTKEDGTYRLQNVAPGNYKLTAVDDDDEFSIAQGDPEDYADVLEVVEVHPLDKLIKDLKRHAQ